MLKNAQTSPLLSAMGGADSEHSSSPNSSSSSSRGSGGRGSSVSSGEGGFSGSSGSSDVGSSSHRSGSAGGSGSRSSSSSSSYLSSSWLSSASSSTRSSSSPSSTVGSNSGSSSSSKSKDSGSSSSSSQKGGGNQNPGSKGAKQISTGKLNDSYAITFPGALPVKQVVWAQEKSQPPWKRASVIHARLRQEERNGKRSFSLFSGDDYFASHHGVCSESNSSTSSSSSSSPPKALSEESLAASRYDYYLHWEGMDRRLDCWVKFEDIRSLKDPLPEGDEVILNVDHHSDGEHAGMDEEYLREHEEATKVKTIGSIRMGNHSVDCWYFSPYPREYQNVDVLYICEFCLSFFRYESEMMRHMALCECRHPPGNEIYRHDGVAMFEIDGTYGRTYCENLCYLSKLFLDHKTLRHPVNLFLFYVMTEIDEEGYHITGYFSKEKYSRNNVSCILILPQDLSDLTCIDANDIITCLEDKGLLVNRNDCSFIILPEKKQKFLLKTSASKKSKPVIMDKLHWTPYDQYLKPFEYNSQA